MNLDYSSAPSPQDTSQSWRLTVVYVQATRSLTLAGAGWLGCVQCQSHGSAVSLSQNCCPGSDLYIMRHE